ncbi:MAG: nitronate monooxygenase, partial [Clostridia bacterium]|nr:nitronate monooxygenase [Clostridia bacterium]
EQGGADAISLINTLSCMAINYKTRKPILFNNNGGVSGACVKPVALKMVWDCYNAVKIPIIGLGGITSYTDVLEFMICGARAVQIGTHNFTEPLGARDIAKDLENYVNENDMDINDLVGTLILNK